MVNIAFSFPYNAFSKLILILFTFIDGVFYQLFTFVTWGFTSVMNTTLISNDQLRLIINRFYVIIGIYMLFRLALTLVNSIIDPDKMNDKNAGLSKIISRVIITLLMLMFVPSLFTYALDAQTDILATIPKIILGRGNTMTSEENYQTANSLALTTWSAFIVPNDGCDDLDSNDGVLSGGTGALQMDTIYNLAIEKCANSNTGYPVFKYTYWFLIPTITAIFMTIVMLVYTIGVATRLFKLAVLQILSPIAVISYIDPKSDKNGPFNSWLKLTIQTYLDIFIKMAVVYFVLALISTALEGINAEGLVIGALSAVTVRAYISVFIIIGGFVFMFSARKFIDKALGLDKNKEKGTFGKLLGAAATGVVFGGIAGAAGSMFQAGSVAAHGKKGLEAVKAFGSNALKKENLISGLKSGVSHGFGSGEKFSLASTFNASRDVAAMMSTGDPNAKHKSYDDLARDKVIAKQLENRGVNDTSLKGTKENVDRLSKLKEQRETYRSHLQALKSAATKHKGLSQQEQHWSSVLNDSSASAEERNHASQELANVRAGMVASENDVQSALRSIENVIATGGFKDADGKWNSNEVDINFEDLGFSLDSYCTDDNAQVALDNLLSNVNDNIGKRAEVISEANKQFESVKGAYKAARAPVKGKPADKFSYGNDFGTIDQLSHDKNK